ncbi:MAG: polysaccharide biosynthesis C-terminal domain-containing protein [Myxococcales bacterium]|nr:polysaccharide biosynthesis C-terminal domain-containing protein [Myxococcales bacterium]
MSEPAAAATTGADRSVWKNVLGIALGNAAGEVFTVAVQALVIAQLGAAGFGRFAQAQAFAEVADGVGSFGLNQVGPVLAVAHRERLGAFLGTLLAVRLTGVILVFFGTWALLPALDISEPGLALLAMGLVFATPFLATAAVPLFLNQHNWRVAWIPASIGALQLGFVGIALWLWTSVVAVILATLAARAVHVALLTAVVRRLYGIRLSLDRDVAKAILRVSPKAAWLDSVVILYTRASYLVLDSLGPVVLGYYALADRIATPFLRVSGAFSAASLTVLADFATRGQRAELTAFYLRNVRRLVVILAGMGLLLALVVPAIILGFFPDWQPTLPILGVLYVGVCFMAVNQVSSATLNALGRFGRVAVVATVNLLVYGVGIALWFERHGAMGAAYATTLMEGCNCLMQMGLLYASLKPARAG